MDADRAVRAVAERLRSLPFCAATFRLPAPPAGRPRRTWSPPSSRTPAWPRTRRPRATSSRPGRGGCASRVVRHAGGREWRWRSAAWRSSSPARAARRSALRSWTAGPPARWPRRPSAVLLVRVTAAGHGAARDRQRDAVGAHGADCRSAAVVAGRVRRRERRRWSPFWCLGAPAAASAGSRWSRCSWPLPSPASSSRPPTAGSGTSPRLAARTDDARPGGDHRLRGLSRDRRRRARGGRRRRAARRAAILPVRWRWRTTTSTWPPRRCWSSWDPARRVVWRNASGTYLADHVTRFAVSYGLADGRRARRRRDGRRATGRASASCASSWQSPSGAAVVARSSRPPWGRHEPPPRRRRLRDAGGAAHHGPCGDVRPGRASARCDSLQVVERSDAAAWRAEAVAGRAVAAATASPPVAARGAASGALEGRGRR